MSSVRNSSPTTTATATVGGGSPGGRQLVVRPGAEITAYKQQQGRGRDPEETRHQTPVPGDQVLRAGVFIPPRTDYLYGPSLPCPSPKSADLVSPLRGSPTTEQAPASPKYPSLAHSGSNGTAAHAPTASSPAATATGPAALESLPVTDTGGAPQQPRSILSVRYDATGKAPGSPSADGTGRLRPRGAPLDPYRG